MPSTHQLRSSLFLITYAIALLAPGQPVIGMGRKPLDNRFRYNVSDYARTDPKQVLFQETSPIRIPLQSPKGIAVDDADRIYIAGDSHLVRFTAKGKQEWVRSLDTHPRCIAVAKNGRLIIGFRSRIMTCQPDGSNPTEWSSLGENAIITSLAASSNNVYVADAGNHVVMHFTADGALMGIIGKKNKAKGLPGFIIPSPYFDIALDRTDTLWVVDPGRQQVAKLHHDGTRSAAWGRASMNMDGFSGCCNPSHIAIRANGDFVTSEKGLPRVKLYTSTGRLKGVVAGTEAFTENTVGLDLATDSQGRILVLDPKRRQIRIFLPKPEPFSKTGRKKVG